MTAFLGGSQVQVLSRDIRSVHQRRKNDCVTASNPDSVENSNKTAEPDKLVKEKMRDGFSPVSLVENQPHCEQKQDGDVSLSRTSATFKVVLAGVEVGYEVDYDGHVVVTSASPTD